MCNYGRLPDPRHLALLLEPTNIVAHHMSAINDGATPKYDDEGKYIGYDTSTMGTFADKVLAGNAKEFYPPTLPRAYKYI